MIKSINGERLKEMIVGAATLLDNHKETLNALNVFSGSGRGYGNKHVPYNDFCRQRSIDGK